MVCSRVQVLFLFSLGIMRSVMKWTTFDLVLLNVPPRPELLGWAP
jgi:hypothetical protein